MIRLSHRLAARQVCSTQNNITRSTTRQVDCVLKMMFVVLARHCSN